MSHSVVSLIENVKTTGPKITVSAPGKVIIHGEHSVVYGKLAIAASIGLRTKLTLQEINQPDLIVQFQKLNYTQSLSLHILDKIVSNPLPINVPLEEYNWEFPDLVNFEELSKEIDNLLASFHIESAATEHIVSLKAFCFLFVAMFGSTNVKLKSMYISISGDLNTGAGLGSSASYSVCLAAAFLQYIKIQLKGQNFSKNIYKPSQWEVDDLKFSDKELDLICKWAFCAEKIVHGRPSGLDNTICTYGSIVEYRKGDNPKLLKLSCPFNLLLINTKIPRETKNLVAKVASLNTDRPDDMAKVFDNFNSIANAALTHYKELSNTNNPGETEIIYNALSRLLLMNHKLLNSIGVGNQRLDEIITVLEEAELGGKMTGAGGGGYAICLVPPSYGTGPLNAVIQELISRGFEVQHTIFGGEGVRLE